MTKIFSTPKEVLTKVEVIPPADMEKIQKLLDSYIGKDLELPSKLVSATVIRELERSGWVVRDTGYSVYKIHPKNTRVALQPRAKSSAIPWIGTSLMFVMFGGGRFMAPCSSCNDCNSTLCYYIYIILC